MKRIFKKHLFRLLMLTGIFPALMTSCNYLSVEQYLNDLMSLDTVFARQDYLERYIGGTAGLLPGEGNLFSNSHGPYCTAVDEVLLSWQKSEYAGTFLYTDKITPESGHYNRWGSYYKGIRKCNTIFARIDECKDLKAIDKREFLGLTYFMRASFYFYLLELYGPVPIVPEIPMSVDDELDALSFERNTYDECVEYICKDFEKAYQLLDGTRPSSLIDRPTKYVAAAYISRVRLYQASPWYNGNTFYSDWKTSDGRNLIAQEKDLTKWAKSAAASKRIIDCGLYALYTMPSDKNTQVAPNAPKDDFPNGVGGIDPFHSYSDMFTDEKTMAVRNTEFIYITTLSNNTFHIAAPILQGGWNGLGITQKVIDAYLMNDGSEYVQPDDYFAPTGSVPTIATDYALTPTVAKMFLNREPRFYASIGFNECLWPGLSLVGSTEEGGRTNLVVTYNVNGTAPPEAQNPENYNLTGYTLKKYIHPEDNGLSYNGKGKVRVKAFPIFRYAEILLNYVEAINEIKGEPEYSEEVEGTMITVSYQPEKIMEYFNMIRYRAGLPGITLNEASDQEMVRQLIKRERMVEFLCEGRRYHDLRRWGIANEEENKPIQGMDITQKVADRAAFYTVVNVYHKYALRTFEDKMYFYPIPKGVINKNPKLIQNPGWDGWASW